MFERRLRILLCLVSAMALLLAGRLVHVQVLRHDYWTGQAELTLRRTTLLQTTRGAILDARGRPLAFDAPCMDAAVDYRAVLPEPDEVWVNRHALRRVRDMPAEQFSALPRERRIEILKQERLAVRADIIQMWRTLARISDRTDAEMDELRLDIVRKVQLRKRFIWYRNWQSALAEAEQRTAEPWYRSWLVDASSRQPELDRFEVTVSEEEEPHVVLPNLSTDAYNYLAKRLDQSPGLVLQASKYRSFPQRDLASHVIGNLARVSREDLEQDPIADDERRRYQLNDLTGKRGVEWLCEPILRGARGRIERSLVGEGRLLSSEEPEAGRDVQLSIDLDLQRDVQRLFATARAPNPDRTFDTLPMHGAAVLIDVRSGRILAMVSTPTYDLERFEESYERLRRDTVNLPLLNRATQVVVEPGSTVKPIVGLGAITDGHFRRDETLECTGYLTIGGRRYRFGRCWVASQFAHILGENGVAHHPIPSEAPHPTGFLAFPDALERSCNPFFEVLADRMGLDGLAGWMDRFGLGRRVGIGLSEATGYTPADFAGPAHLRRSTTWLGGMGQGHIGASVLQMANVAATLARNGVWMRPTLLDPEVIAELRRLGRYSTEGSDRVDLGLDPVALAQARQGMVAVVASRAGTGTAMRVRGLKVAGKTGSAQAGKLMVQLLDDRGEPLRDDAGRPQRRELAISTRERPNPEAPWYRGTGADGRNLAHAWVIGYAPADDPVIAFAVLVEYGGAGGASAGALASQALEACIRHGYLRADGPAR